MKLLIENFYNIKYAELDLKKFNILIGPQAAGKSLIAKAYHTLVEGLNLYNLSFLNEQNPEFIVKRIKNLLSSTFEHYSKNDNPKLQLSAEGMPCLTITQSKIELSDRYLKVSQKFAPKAKELLLEAVSTDNDKTNLALNMIIEGILDAKHPFSLFIPASRSLVNIVAENLFWMPDNNIDHLLNRFGRLYFNHLKNITSESRFECPQLNSLIKGHIEKKNNTYSVNEQGRVTTLTNASSGQQATIPIVIALEAAKTTSGRYIFIEEPEAHIFPEAQYTLTGYISEIQNQTNADITLTTHSPYILTAVNNLIYAGTVGKQSEEKAAKIREVIPETQWLNSNDVAAYMVEADGTVRSIMDEETGLIDADSIDNVSSIIGTEFDKLLDIEYEEGTANA